MLSKTCVKAALLLIPPGAAAHPVPLPCVCPPPADAVCLHFFLGGRGCALTVPCWMTPEQSPLQELPAWPVATPAAPVGASLADPQGWLHSEPWDALPAARCRLSLGLSQPPFTG